MNDEKKCIICDKTVEFEFVSNIRDDDTRSVYQCQACDHVQLWPLPTQIEDNEFYQSGKMYRSIFNDEIQFLNEEKLMYRYRNFVYEQSEQLVKHLSKVSNPKILDVGTGYGWLVEFMLERGYQIDGVELSDEKRALCKKRCGIDIFDYNFLEETPDASELFGNYDVICLMQVLEHINDPKLFLRRVKKLLKSGGMVFIDVPNYDDYMKQELPEYNSFTYSRMHLSYFTSETLTFCLEGSGFVNIETYGHQLYSFENVLWWLREKKPFFDYHQIDVPDQLCWLNDIYKQKLETQKKSNLLIGIGYNL